MSKFTPGPWNFHVETGSIDTDEGYSICELAFGFSSLDDAELEQDGRLISAAPALYEALKETRKRLQDANEVGIITDTLWYSEYETLFDYVDAALALVGEQI